jgi:hypothetical protein
LHSKQNEGSLELPWFNLSVQPKEKKTDHGTHSAGGSFSSSGLYRLNFQLRKLYYEKKNLNAHGMLEAGLFESKIRIRYACVHLGGFTKEISSSH